MWHRLVCFILFGGWNGVIFILSREWSWLNNALFIQNITLVGFTSAHRKKHDSSIRSVLLQCHISFSGSTLTDVLLVQYYALAGLSSSEKTTTEEHDPSSMIRTVHHYIIAKCKIPSFSSLKLNDWLSMHHFTPVDFNPSEKSWPKKYATITTVLTVKLCLSQARNWVRHCWCSISQQQVSVHHRNNELSSTSL